MRKIFLFYLALSIVLVILLINLVSSKTCVAPFVSSWECEPECHININACYENGGTFGYDKDGNCYCDMSNVPIKPAVLENIKEDNSTAVIVETGYTVLLEKPKTEKNQEEISNLSNQSNITQELNNITDLSIGNQPEKCSGCLLNESCYPVNNVKDNKFCSINKEWKIQGNDNEFCENNFECQSNLCVNKACINQGFLQKIIDWFTKLFS